MPRARVCVGGLVLRWRYGGGSLCQDKRGNDLAVVGFFPFGNCTVPRSRAGEAVFFYQAEGSDHQRLLWRKEITGCKHSQYPNSIPPPPTLSPSLISLFSFSLWLPLSCPYVYQVLGHCILMSISNFSCLVSCLTPLIHQYIIRDKVLWTPAAVTR